MKYLISLSLVLIIGINLLEWLPVTKAPVEEFSTNILQAALLSDKQNDLERQSLTPKEKELYISLLDIYVEQERDLPKAAALIDQKRKEQENEKLLDLYEAKILARSLDFETALALINRVDSQELSLLKAAVLISLDERDKAIAYLYNIIENDTDPIRVSTALSLLNVYQDHEGHREADESYLWVVFAKHFAELKEYEISQYLLNKALQLQPEYRDAWLIKGLNELQLKDYSAAEASLLNAYQYDPGNQQIQYLLGHTYFLQEQYELSEQYFLYSLQKESPFAEEVYGKLGDMAMKRQDFALAGHYFQQVLEHDSDNAYALSQLISLYGEQLNDLDYAKTLAQKRLSSYPSDPESTQLLRWIEDKQALSQILTEESS